MELDGLKRKKIFLIVIITFLIVALLTLGLYILLKDNKEDNKKTDAKKELTNLEMSLVIEDFPYDKLLNNKDLSVSDLTRNQILLIGFSLLKEKDITEKAISDACLNKTGNPQIECIAKELGLSDEDINKINISLWGSMLGGSNGYSTFSVEAINKVIENRLGLSNQFNESFNENIKLDCGSLDFAYDKNINSFFEHFGGGCNIDGITIYATYLESGYKAGDNYTINIVEGAFSPYEYDSNLLYRLHARSDSNNILKEDIVGNGVITDEMKELVKQYSNNLDKYEITFKKSGDNYQFESLKTIK